MDVKKRMEIERLIVRHLVKTAIDAGYTVSLHDGEEWAVALSQDVKAIMAEVHSTDEQTIRIRDAERNHLGSVTLVYGNDGYDVMADMTDTAYFREFLKPTEAYAEKFERRYAA